MLPVNICSKAMRDERGATVIEYALITAFIALVIIGVLGSIGTGLSSTFGLVTTQMNG